MKLRYMFRNCSSTERVGCRQEISLTAPIRGSARGSDNFTDKLQTRDATVPAESIPAALRSRVSNSYLDRVDHRPSHFRLTLAARNRCPELLHFSPTPT